MGIYCLLVKIIIIDVFNRVTISDGCQEDGGVFVCDSQAGVLWLVLFYLYLLECPDRQLSDSQATVVLLQHEHVVNSCVKQILLATRF